MSCSTCMSRSGGGEGGGEDDQIEHNVKLNRGSPATAGNPMLCLIVQVWYILFLLLYSYVVLFDLRETITPAEWTVHLYIASLILNEIPTGHYYPEETFSDRVRDWWSFGTQVTWNRVDLIIYFLSIFAFILRFFPAVYPLARLMFILSLGGYIISIFKLYIANSYLGPKVIMIERMTKDLMLFILMLVVFTAAYSVMVQGLYNAGHGYTQDAFWNLYQVGVWEVFGEINENSMAGTVRDCPSNATQWDWDCSLRSWTIPILLLFYLFFVAVLLINMLIAIFTHIFERVQSSSKKIWSYHMYFLVEEYKDKVPPPFPPLLFIFKLLYMVLRKISHKLCRSRYETPKDSMGIPLHDEEEKRLRSIELACHLDFVREMKATEQSNVNNANDSLNERLGDRE